MKFELILFDADDTLFDFAASQKQTFFEIINQFGLPDQFEEIFKTYLKISLTMWQQVERGELSKDALKTRRFAETFNHHKIALDPEKVSQAYLNLLPENIHLFPEALATCKTLSKYSRLGVITNGIDSIQKRKFEKSGLNEWIEFVVISDQCGYAKPDPRIFDYTLNLAKHSNRSTALMVGDRIDVDVFGANQSGIPSCWFNPQNSINRSEIKPTFIIQELPQLIQITSS